MSVSLDKANFQAFRVIGSLGNFGTTKSFGCSVVVRASRSSRWGCFEVPVLLLLVFLIDAGLNRCVAIARLFIFFSYSLCNL